MLDHKANFIYVADQHHPWGFRGISDRTNQASNIILREVANLSQIGFYNLAHFCFMTGDAIGFGKFLK